MDYWTDNHITVKDAAEVLKISVRAVQQRCKRAEIRQRFGFYLIPLEIFEEWKLKIENKRTQNEHRNEHTHEPTHNDKSSTKNNATIDELKHEIDELKQELEQYEVADNERIEIFTNEDYEVFESRLLEWFTLQKDLEHQEQLFAAEKKSSEELLIHYKNQFEYQRNQSTRILEMHEKLIQTIQLQAKNTIQRTIIEAADKEVIDKNSWKQKKTRPPS